MEHTSHLPCCCIAFHPPSRLMLNLQYRNISYHFAATLCLLQQVTLETFEYVMPSPFSLFSKKVSTILSSEKRKNKMNCLKICLAPCCCCSLRVEEDALHFEVPRRRRKADSTTDRGVSFESSPDSRDLEKEPRSPSRQSFSSFFSLKKRSRHSKRDSWSTTTSQFEHPAVRPLSAILRPRSPGHRPRLNSRGSWSSEASNIQDDRPSGHPEVAPISEKREPAKLQKKQKSQDAGRSTNANVHLPSGTSDQTRDRETEKVGFEPEEKPPSRLPVIHENLRASIHSVCKSRPLTTYSINAFHEVTTYPRPVIRAEISIDLNQQGLNEMPDSSQTAKTSKTAKTT